MSLEVPPALFLEDCGVPGRATRTGSQAHDRHGALRRSGDISPVYWEKPYYLLPDGDDADEGYFVLRDALKSSNKAAIGQLIMHGREHPVGITALGKGLVLEVLRYAHEVRPAEQYFEKISAKPEADAVQLAKKLIEMETRTFQPEKMPNEYANAVHELVRAKFEQRTPEVVITEERPAAPVINIMDALKKSMQAKGRAKVQDAVRRRHGAAEGSAS